MVREEGTIGGEGEPIPFFFAYTRTSIRKSQLMLEDILFGSAGVICLVLLGFLYGFHEGMAEQRRLEERRYSLRREHRRTGAEGAGK